MQGARGWVKRWSMLAMACLLAGGLLGAGRGAVARESAPQGPVVSFRYLESLQQSLELPGKGTITCWRVSPASLRARSSSHEVGPPHADLVERTDLVSVLDIAWVALAYLKHYELHKAPASLATAKKALASLLVLQRPDGSYPAYLSSGQQRTPSTDDDWMATARATQALGAAYRLAGKSDRDLARHLEKALGLTEQRVRVVWSSPGHSTSDRLALDGQRYPAWLPGHRADAAAGLALGLLDWYEAAQGQAAQARDTARVLCEGIAELQQGNPTTYPFGGLLPRADEPTLWYPDGSLQGAALARASVVLARPTWLTAAMRDADGMLAHLLVFYGQAWQFTPRPDPYPQTSAGAACVAINQAALHRATNKDRFAVMAGLALSWLGGSNGKAGVYDPGQGRCADLVTLQGPETCASPASTAMALYALLEVSSGYGKKFVAAKSTPLRLEPLVVEAADGRAVGTPFSLEEVSLPGGRHRVARLAHDNAFWLRFLVPQAALYQVDMVYLKEPTAGLNVTVRLDGDGILRIPLDGSDRGTVLGRKNVVGPTRLEAGLHILGVRGDRLMLSRQTGLSSFVIQPLTGWRVWETSAGHLAMLQNLSESRQSVDLPASLRLARARTRHATAWDEKGASVPIEESKLVDGSLRFTLPAGSCGIIEW